MNKYTFLHEFRTIFYVLSITYTFYYWGFWWGLSSFLLPIYPILDLVWFIIEQITSAY